MNLLCYIVSVFCFIVFMLYSKNDFSCFHSWKFGVVTVGIRALVYKAEYNISIIIRLHRITIFYGEQFMRYIIASHFIVIFSFILRSFRITFSVVLTLSLIVHSKKTKRSGDAQLAHVYEGAKGPTSSVESLML